MRKYGWKVVITIGVCALLHILFLSISVAREIQLENGHDTYALGFDYSPLPDDNDWTWLNLAVYDRLPSVLPQIDITQDSEPIDNTARRWASVQAADPHRVIETKTAFKTLQNLKKEDDRLVYGNIALMSLFDTGDNALGRQAGVDFLSDRLEDEKQEMPETLAMLLLGTGLIGLARIQRKHMQD